MPPDLSGMTIDELARRAATTTRKLRLYQTKGLLPPPRIIGRTGYYSDAHVNRLSLIERLQKRGFSLASITQLLESAEAGRSIDDVLGYEAELTRPWHDESPAAIEQADLSAKFPSLHADEAMLERAIAAGLLSREGDRFRVRSPQLLEVGAELVRRGLPAEVALAELEQMRADAVRIATRVTTQFRTYLLPELVRGEPKEWLLRLATFVGAFRPALRSALVISIMQAIDDEVRSFRVGLGAGDGDE